MAARNAQSQRNRLTRPPQSDFETLRRSMLTLLQCTGTEPRRREHTAITPAIQRQSAVTNLASRRIITHHQFTPSQQVLAILRALFAWTLPCNALICANTNHAKDISSTVRALS